MADDPGVLGNLPRSRPGRRSEKRASGGVAPKGTRATTGKAAAAKTAGGTRSGRTPAAPRRTAAKPRSAAKPRTGQQPEPQPAEQPGDPLTGAIRAAGTIAEAGVKTAAKLAGGVLKRFPRP